MTCRNSNPPQNSVSRATLHIARTDARGRPPTKLRTIEETAEFWNVSPRTVRRLIESHALPVHRFGRLVRISEADIEAFLARNRGV
jgi:excisionase family DNA binding protein